MILINKHNIAAVLPATPKLLTGQFPNTDLVIPKPEDASFSVSVNSTYLQELAASAKKFGAQTIKLSFYGKSAAGGKPIRMDAKNEGQTWIAVLMPVRE